VPCWSAQRNSGAQRQQFLEDVENLLGTLVDISKLDAGVIKADIAPFALSELLDNLAAEYTQVARSEGLELHFVGCSALVRSDIQLLARILRNLLSNAIRYTYSGAWCWAVGASTSACRSRSGTAAWALPKIAWRRFSRSSSAAMCSVPTRTAGSAWAWRSSKRSPAFSGIASVRSWPGKGSMFCVEVPLSATAPQAAEPLMSEPMLERLRGARVWVLDNDAAICAGMRTLLEGWGCRVVTALSEEDLARQVDNYHAEADLLIADYHLDNDQNGVDAVARINARRGSADPGDDDHRQLQQRAQAADPRTGHTLMHKPVRPMKLKTAMSHLLARPCRVGALSDMTGSARVASSARYAAMIPAAVSGISRKYDPKSISPALRIACTRLCTLSLRRIAETWAFTVVSAISRV
jgi:CheY-like chemotaxis protein